MVSPQGKVFGCDATIMTGIQELMQPSFPLEPLLTPLVETLVHLLNNVHIQSRSEMSFGALFTIVCVAKNIIISNHTFLIWQLSQCLTSFSVFIEDPESVK